MDASAKCVDLGKAGVVVAAPDPLVAHGNAVVDQRCFVAAPHFGRRMVLPAVGWIVKRVQNLEAFDALFAKSLVVQNASRFGEAAKRKEGLHDSIIGTWISWPLV